MWALAVSRSNASYRAVSKSFFFGRFIVHIIIACVGKVVIAGKSLAINADFAQQATFLAQQLGCSEKYIASILHTIMTQNSNMNAVDCMEAAVVEFHQRRRHLSDSLHYIFEIAELAHIPNAPPLYGNIESFAERELIPAVKVPDGEIPLAYRIFTEINNLIIVIARTQIARQNAGSNTTFSSAQGQPPRYCVHEHCFNSVR